MCVYTAVLKWLSGVPTRVAHAVPLHVAFSPTLYIVCRLSLLFSRCLQASLNFDDPTLKSLLKALPEAPAMAQRQCLQRCGLYDGDDGDLELSYDYDSDGGDEH